MWGKVISSSGGGIGNVVLTATQTFSGSNTFAGTGATTTIKNQFTLAAGSTITTSGQITESTFTIGIPQTSGTNNSFAGCNIAGSTITATIGSSSSTVFAYLDAMVLNTVAALNVSIWILMDGNFPAGGSASYPSWFQTTFVGSYQESAFAHARFTNVSQGTHTFCFGMGTSGGTWRFNDAGQRVNEFWTETKK